MKASEFKNLIKEAVREVIKEELLELKQQPVQEQTQKQPARPTGNTIADMLAETASSMTSQDYRNVIGADSSMAQGFRGASTRTAHSVNTGLDLSNLSFVKNAGEILRVSNQKDKTRHGL